MSIEDTVITGPVKMTLAPEQGQLKGSNQRYEKRLPDLAGLYQDVEAFTSLLTADAGQPVYWVESSQTEDGPGGLITGLSVLEPGQVGMEYVMTRGHIHRRGDRSEMYLGVAGQGVMLLETVDGQSQAIEIGPGEAVYVPKFWVHRSINVGSERLVTFFSYASDAGQDYDIIERAGGMQQLVVVDDDSGWTTRPNPRHTGYTAEPHEELASD